MEKHREIIGHRECQRFTIVLYQKKNHEEPTQLLHVGRVGDRGIQHIKEHFGVQITIMRQALLLDFDGVILRHPRATQTIISRSERYANKFLKLRSQTALTIVNREIYKLAGHTVNGLKDMGYPASHEDFNHDVYSDLDYDYLFENLHETNRKDIETLKELQNACNMNQIDLKIFSNAPDAWCEAALNRMKSEELLDIKPIMGSQHPDVAKPELRVYQKIEEELPDTLIHFVDDRFENLSKVCGNGKWKNYLFIDSETPIQDLRPSEIFFGNLSIINNLGQVINHMKQRSRILSQTDGHIPAVK